MNLFRDKFDVLVLVLLWIATIPLIVHFQHHGDSESLKWSTGVGDSVLGALLLILNKASGGGSSAPPPSAPAGTPVTK